MRKLARIRKDELPGERQTVNDATTQPDEYDRTDMVRLASGDAAALNDLMQRHAPRLFSYALRCLQNESDASEIAQESFVRVFQYRAKFNPREKFSTWLYSIATNLIKDCYRYRARHPKVSLDAEIESVGEDFRERIHGNSPSPSESLEGAERAEAVRKAIAGLPEEIRTPLILSQYEELPHAEIGKILNCSAKAVETRLYRARNQLRQKLERLL
ncbi:MAG TPA: sigma-70 family RNA polymerase sigma factor [Candidatus Angelobacter sp.]|nr:sigma-70 family RNA polymerase sigma factor [Candidatus Angelobacter sp.]